eukprot:Gregarina_sp_Poly_1__4883@NODE_2599_length_1934_cov_10_091591_g1647_i0_p1_GENE_NODE_2599_length_1934_cov_10_091591_g1647_i0NODE_2599_length_1934_cov_10_091591_g1647_i0_p1_ORF_typecomplete_len185_score12_06_NODE_2599_length_1934_cov_10_091591_g1647_i0108662
MNTSKLCLASLVSVLLGSAQPFLEPNIAPAVTHGHPEDYLPARPPHDTFEGEDVVCGLIPGDFVLDLGASSFASRGFTPAGPVLLRILPTPERTDIIYLDLTSEDGLQAQCTVNVDDCLSPGNISVDILDCNYGGISETNQVISDWVTEFLNQVVRISLDPYGSVIVAAEGGTIGSETLVFYAS